MSMEPHHIPELDRKGLREFALVTSAVIVVLFGVFLPWLLGRAWPVWPWILATVLVAMGLAVPMALGPVYKLWMRFGLLLSRITTPIIMGLVFFLMITPIGAIRRIVSKDPLNRTLHDGPSYRVPSVKRHATSMERPF